MTVTHALALLAVIGGACGVATLTRAKGVATPVLLVLAGLAVSAIPGMPVFRLNPQFVLIAGRRLRLPRRLLLVITGESMLNDGTALTLYTVAVAAAAGLTTPSRLQLRPIVEGLASTDPGRLAAQAGLVFGAVVAVAAHPPAGLGPGTGHARQRGMGH